MHIRHIAKLVKLARAVIVIPLVSFGTVPAQATPGQGPLAASINPDNGWYSLAAKDGQTFLRNTAVGVKVDGRWIHPDDYSRPTIIRGTSTGELGNCQTWEVTYAGTQSLPSLIYKIRTYTKLPAGDIEVIVRNSTTKNISVQDIRSVDVKGSAALSLGARETDDRILSDSVSENRPVVMIHDLADVKDQSHPMHRGVGSQLIYNPQSGRSLFFGALTSDKFLTILRLRLGGSTADRNIAAYEVDSAGTTELTKEDSLQEAPQEDQIELSLSVPPDKDLRAERLFFSFSNDYHEQLTTYGLLIKHIHHARVLNPTPMGWWSWTAYGPNLSANNAVINAQWESRYLKPLGYDFFHIDEGYSIARGDYLRPNPVLFPNGLGGVEKKVAALGLLPACGRRHLRFRKLLRFTRIIPIGSCTTSRASRSG